MNDVLQIVMASLLLDTHGGRAEAAWRVAGEAIDDGMRPEEFFLRGQFELADRLAVANEEVRTAS